MKNPLDQFNLSVMLRVDHAGAVKNFAKNDRRTQSGVMNVWLEAFFRKPLQPLPDGTKVQRMQVGEQRLRRYRLEPLVLDMLHEAEQMGYSKAFIVEEAIKMGLGVK